MQQVLLLLLEFPTFYSHSDSGFEQANKYVIMDAQGNHIGYMAEQEKGLGNAMARQSFRTHRSFVTHVFDRHENEVLRVSFGNSKNS